LYVEPARHAQENGYAEAAVKTVEACVKSMSATRLNYLI